MLPTAPTSAAFVAWRSRLSNRVTDAAHIVYSRSDNFYTRNPNATAEWQESAQPR